MADGVTEEELTQAKNKVLARSVLRSERPMGRLASLGFHWMYRRAYLSLEDELDAFSKRHPRRPPPPAPRLAPLADDHRLRRPDHGHSARQMSRSCQRLLRDPFPWKKSSGFGGFLRE